MVVADLHVHTTNSDGTLTLKTLPAAAREAGVEIVAITDHDRAHPEIDSPWLELDGLTVIHGIELRVETPSQRLDLLGYGLSRTAELDALTDDLQQNRIERGQRIVDCVEDRLGIELDVAVERGIGRPHIARAIAAASSYSYEEAFAELIGNDCPCYVAREIPRFEEGLACLESACAVVGLAHPFRYDDPAAALECATRLDAVEIPYLYGSPVDTTPAKRVANEHDLLVTGGSDAHGTEIGKTGLNRAQYQQFRDAVAVDHD